MDEQYHYKVALKKDANILYLKSAGDILLFHDKYVDPHATLKSYAINWRNLAADYSGIIIAPYCWQMRLDIEVAWYYSWDCASGCIWDAGAVETLELVRKPIKKRKQA